MFKRIMKIFGICMAILVLVVGAGIGIFALSGGFKKVEIDIVKLFIDDETKADKEIYTLEDVTTQINFAPLDATNRELEVIIADPLRVVDEDGNLVKEGILKNVPTKINAGEEFKLEINKDSMGNNVGGVVTLTFRPADGDKVITDFTLKVVVDVAIPNNSLYFAGNDSDIFTTTGKNITMGLSNTQQNIYLKSNLVNAFCLETSNGNLKKAEISYVYKNQKGEEIESKTFNDLEYKPNFNPVTKEYNYYYEVPVTPRVSGTINVTAKMHRTNEIEKAYIEGDFDNMPLPSVNSNAAQIALDKFNAFLNTYIKFFDTTEESYNYFKDYLTEDGKVKLPYGQVEEAKKYIFQTCSTTINITAVNLDSITSTETAKEYNVLSTKTFTLKQMINEYDLSVTLDHSDVANLETEELNLFGTLNVKPYVYVEKTDYLNNKDELWSDYRTVLGVPEFENGKPINVEPLLTDEVEGYTGIGVLLLLERTNATYKDYITITPSSDLDNKTWTIDFNVPLKNNNITNINDVTKALFLQFEVTGRDLNNNTQIVRNTYSRVFIEYTEYSFYDEDNAKIGFPDEIKRMAINSSVQNASSNGYAEKLNQQNIDIKLSSTVSNYNQVQYKSVMYFVEEKSNILESGNGQKVASIGKYNFKYMNTGINNADEMVKLFGTAENLTGERLLNQGTKENPNYYLQAINASTEPVNIFAVVYLSDKDGNPIDINGRPITIDESNEAGDNVTLVVFAITDITESGIEKVYVDSFVENFNYYTTSQGLVTIDDTQIIDEQEVTANYSAEGFVKRNNVTSYTDPVSGITFSEEALAKLQDLLTLKFLYNNQFTLYATNFEWDNTGAISDAEGYDADGIIYLDIKDFNGKVIEDKPFAINTIQNKQIALNNICNDFNDSFELNIKATNSNPVIAVELLGDESGETNNVNGIKFTISVSGKVGTTDDYIYIKPKDSSSVINALNNNQNYVNWKVSQVEVTNAELVDIATYTKLYGRYSNNYSETDYQEFGVLEKNASDNTLIFNKYYLYESGESEIKPSSIEDNLKFVITDNLGTFATPGDETSEFVANLDVVDMSQALFSSSNADDVSNPNNHYFPDLNSYRTYYLKNSNNITFSYLNPSGVYELSQDLIFTTENDNNIHVGTSLYPIEQSQNGRFIRANGREYYLTNNTLVFEAGEYFPIVKTYNDNGKDIIIILGNEFTVNSKLVSGVTKYVINNIEENNEYRREFEVNKLTFNPNDYINDGGLNESARNTALTKEYDSNGNVLNATVSFIKGGVYLKDGLPIYEEDANGKYKYENGEYLICEAGYTGTRYAKKGIKVFLMVTLDGFAFEKPITNVLEYELIQEEIELQATDADKIIDVKDYNEGGHQELSIQAGTTTTVHLLVGNIVPTSRRFSINLIGSSFESNFFKHCKFELDGESSGIKFIVDGNPVTVINQGYTGSSLDIYIPSSYVEDSACIYVSYLYQGAVVKKMISLTVIPDFEFVLNQGTDLEVTSDDYRIYLNANSTYDINELFATYFNIGNSGINVTFNNANSNNAIFSTLNGSELNIGESYALVDKNSSLSSENPIINRDFIEFTITLSNGTSEVTIAKKFRIVINPTYTLDLRRLTNDYSLKVINGEGVLDNKDYIKVYNGYGLTSEVSLSLYKDIFKVFHNSDDFTNSIISSDVLNNVQMSLDLQYVNGFNNTQSYTFAVTVMGYELYYSEDADLGMIGSEDRLDTYDRIKGNYSFLSLTNLYISNGVQINLDDYFAVFTKNNSIETNLYAILKDSSNNYYHDLTYANAGDYTLSIAKFVDGRYVVIRDTAYIVKVNKVELFYSVEGLFTNTTTYENLVGNNYELNDNLTLTSSSIDISNYYKFFLNNEEITVVLVGSDDAEYLTNVTTGTYKVCYKIGEKVYDSGYQLTLNA